MHVYRFFALLVCLMFIMAGCKDNIPKDISETDRIEDTIISTESTESIDIVNPLEDFTAGMPNANVIDTIVHDIDGNGEDDYIILFSVDDDSDCISAGLAVCLSNSLYSGISLDADNRLTFSSGATLSYNEDIPVISFSLSDSESGIDYNFAVEYTIDSVSREVNYSVKSEVKE